MFRPSFFRSYCTFNRDFFKNFKPGRLIEQGRLIEWWEYSSVPNRRACTFISFVKKIPPARPYFGLQVYWFWEKKSTWTFISYCTSIGYNRVFTLKIRGMGHNSKELTKVQVEIGKWISHFKIATFSLRGRFFLKIVIFKKFQIFFKLGHFETKNILIFYT